MYRHLTKPAGISEISFDEISRHPIRRKSMRHRGNSVNLFPESQSEIIGHFPNSSGRLLKIS